MIIEPVSGIYRFFSKTLGKSYVGSSENIKIRVHRHLYLLNKGSHWNSEFLQAWKKFTENDFVISKLEDVPVDKLLDRENYWMEQCYPLFNIVKVAQKGRRGIPHSEESKRKMSESRGGKYCGENSARYGTKLPRETVEKTKKTKLLKKLSGYKINHPGPGIKCREAASSRGKTLVGDKNPNFGRSHSQESRDKIAETHAKTYQLIDPDGKLINITNMRKYCRDNNISRKAMSKLISGETDIMIPLRLRKEKRGWTLHKIVEDIIT